MGIVMSFMGRGLPSSQMFNLLMGTLYKQFTEKEINTFEDFHTAFLDILNTVNSALPGKHYDVPSRKAVEECFYKWETSPGEERKRVFVDFMKRTMKLSAIDDATVMTGIITPPAAMATKKAGENVPQMKMIKAIPDVIFVPSFTLIALISVKLSRKIIQRKRSPPHEEEQLSARHQPSPPQKQTFPAEQTQVPAQTPPPSHPPSPPPKQILPKEEPPAHRPPSPPRQPSTSKQASEPPRQPPNIPKETSRPWYTPPTAFSRDRRTRSRS